MPGCVTLLLVLATLGHSLSSAVAQGTAFTYQGRLAVDGAPAHGLYSFRFLLRQTSNGAQQGPTLTNNTVAVSNGLFATVLDFGDYFGEREFGLEVAVRTNGSVAPFTTLSPTQVIRPAPLAIAANHAELAATVSFVPAAALPSNVALLDGDQIFTGPVTLSHPGNVLGGDGAGLTNLPITSLGAPGTLGYAGALDFGGSRQFPSFGIVSAHVAVGDVNGDGRADLAVANRGSGNVTILTNSRGGFALAATVGSHAGAGLVYLADINLDGRLDVLCANQPDVFNATSDNSITVARNLGNGTFAPSIFLNSTPSLTSLAIGDLNGDLWPDLVAGARSTNVVSIFINNGAGGFPANPSYRFLTATNPNAIALADFTGDGRLDLLSAHGVNSLGSETNVLVHAGDGFGSFGAPVRLATAPGFKTLAAADINRDGLKDVIVGNGQSGARIDILTNSGAGNFALHQTIPTTYINSLTTGDFNGDGWTDVAVIDAGFFGYTGMRMMLSDGTGRLAEGLHLSPFDSRSIAAGDLDGDGQSELMAAGGNDSGAVVVYSFLRRLQVERGLVVNGATTLRGSLNTDQAASFSGVLSVSGQASFSGSLSVAPPAALSFGSQTRQMIHLWDTFYGIGVQNSRLYFRTSSGAEDGFAWLKGGAHSSTPDDPGAGGSLLMSLNANRMMVNAPVGLGTANPQAALHVYSASPLATLRLQSAAQPGAGRIEFLSDPQGSGSEWRPGYIQSTDNGGFTGGLSFVVNGTGFGNRFAEVETMRIVNGRVGIGTPTPVSALQVIGTVTATAFNPPSDRNLKENFAPVSSREVLEKVSALPISRWNFKGDATTPHVGPMAQDFHAAFGLGTDDKHIATVDADGVALAAIQGLNQRLTEELERRDAENAALKARLDRLERLLETTHAAR